MAGTETKETKETKGEADAGNVSRQTPSEKILFRLGCVHSLGEQFSSDFEVAQAAISQPLVCLFGGGGSCEGEP